MTPKVLLLLALYAVSILGDESPLEKFILSFNEKIDGMVCHYISDHANKSMIYNCHTRLVANGSESEMHFIEISGFIHNEAESEEQEAESEEQEDESEEQEDESDEEEDESEEQEDESEEQEDESEEQEEESDEEEDESDEEQYLDAITNDGQIYEDDHSGLYENSTNTTF